MISTPVALLACLLTSVVSFVREADGIRLEEGFQLTDSVAGMKQFLSSKWNKPVEKISLSYAGQSNHTCWNLQNCTPVNLYTYIPSILMG